MFVSCSLNSNKQKELELKERELALKEKEFALDSVKKSISIEKNSKLETHKPIVNSTTAHIEQPKEKSFTDKICGLWKHRGQLNAIGEINIDFIKITKENNGKLKFKKGSYSINKDGNDKKSEQDIMWETNKDVYPKLLNDNIEGKYRIWEGSAPDAYSDTKFNIELKSDKILLFKSNIQTGGGNNYNESFEATKISN